MVTEVWTTRGCSWNTLVSGQREAYIVDNSDGGVDDKRM